MKKSLVLQCLICHAICLKQHRSNGLKKRNLNKEKAIQTGIFVVLRSLEGMLNLRRFNESPLVGNGLTGAVGACDWCSVMAVRYRWLLLLLQPLC